MSTPGMQRKNLVHLPLEGFRLRGFFVYSHGRGRVHSGRFSVVSIRCAGMRTQARKEIADASILWYDPDKSGFIWGIQ